MSDERRDFFLIDRFYDQYMEDLQRWRREGKTKEEAKQMIDRRVLTDEDVEKVYGLIWDDTEDKNNVTQEETNKEEVIQEDESHDNNSTKSFEENIEKEDYEYKIEEENEINNINEEIDYADDSQYNYETKEDFNVEKIEKTNEDTNENINEETNEETNEDTNEVKNEEIEENNDSQNNIETEIKYLKFEDLEDYPDQPFKLYNEERNEEMIRSIKINGIIQPLIVRPMENGKYQILSGHNRKYCGKRAGIDYFPCKVKKGLTDDEAKLYLVDANLATREEILPSERAKALLMRQSAYRSKRIKEKIESELYGDVKGLEVGSIRDKIQSIENMSSGNLQRYLRLNFLDEGLQQLVDQKKLQLKQAENISYLKKPEQKMIAKMITNDNKKISENQAKLLKDSKDILSIDLIKKILDKTPETAKKITIEIDKFNGFYDDYINDLKELKERVIKDIIEYNLAKMEKNSLSE